MILRPRLINAVMDMPIVWKSFSDTVTHFRVDVELWKSVGLCIHPANIIHWKKGNGIETWSVSHYQSGMYLSEKFISKDEALQFMMDVRKNVLQDWRMSFEQIQAREDFNVIKQKIRSMRKDGVNVKNVQGRKRKTGC